MSINFNTIIYMGTTIFYVWMALIVIGLSLPIFDYVYWYYIKKPNRTLEEVDADLEKVSQEIKDETNFKKTDSLLDYQDMLTNERERIISYNRRIGKK